MCRPFSHVELSLQSAPIWSMKVLCACLWQPTTGFAFPKVNRLGHLRPLLGITSKPPVPSAHLPSLFRP